jgi:hypothetical protein
VSPALTRCKSPLPNPPPQAGEGAPQPKLAPKGAALKVAPTDWLKPAASGHAGGGAGWTHMKEPIRLVHSAGRVA